MLNLFNANTDKLQLVTDSGAAVDVHASFVDLIVASNSISGPGRQNTAIASATTTDIVGTPGSGLLRNVKTLHIRNKSNSTSVVVTVLYNNNGTTFELHSSALAPGEELEYVEGVGFFEIETAAVVDLMKALASDDTGTNVATAQPWFPTAGGVTVTGDTTYKMEGFLHTTRAAGVTSHTTGLLFAGTATLTSIRYRAGVNTGDVSTNLAMNQTTIAVATNTTVKAASTSATEETSIYVDGIVRINAAGTFIPQFIYSAAPGGAPTIKANSFFKLTRMGNGSFTAQGTWA